MNYKRFTSHMTVGNRVDSLSNYTLAAYYYRSGTSNTYRNDFHFIELPVLFAFQLNKQNRAPIYLDAGFSISRLVSPAALQYEAISGSYYKDDELFNKNQLNLSLGLLFSLSKARASNPLLVGPDVNFS